MTGADNLTLIRGYLDAIEREDVDALGAFLHPELVHREHPNKLLPNGAERGRDQMLEGARRGKMAVQGQRYEILSSVSDGDRIAVSIRWTATSRVPLAILGKNAGDVLEARFAIFVRFEGGRVIEQDNFDCFLP